MSQRQNTITALDNYYPQLHERITALDQIGKADFRAWLMSSQGIGCSTTKAAEIFRGIHRGGIAEQQAIALYLGRSSKTLFKQS